MEVHLYQRQRCGKCEATNHKVGFLIEKLGLTGRVSVVTRDIDTVDGMAEAAFEDVYYTPTTIIKQNGREIIRWDGVIPSIEDLKEVLRSA